MGGVRFLFDECLSPKLADALNHCGKKHSPRISVETLKGHGCLGIDDPTWITRLVTEDVVVVSEDVAMISDHDIARMMEGTPGVMMLLKPDVSQMKRWGLLKWHLEHLPRLAAAKVRVQPGTTWLVGKDGRLSAVTPSRRQ